MVIPSTLPRSGSPSKRASFASPATDVIKPFPLFKIDGLCPVEYRSGGCGDLLLCLRLGKRFKNRVSRSWSVNIGLDNRSIAARLGINVPKNIDMPMYLSIGSYTERISMLITFLSETLRWRYTDRILRRNTRKGMGRTEPGWDMAESR
jgi:hypothetical protein